MAKKTFDGEGNPSSLTLEEDVIIRRPAATTTTGHTVTITAEELRVLKTLLDRDRTSRLVHGGLKSLLTMNDDDIKTLLGFLDRV